ncbi:RT21 protein, partial [Psilopogon haemacephalus]|nr:RT21 protein [Psilopogon haemacephalus]
LSRILSQDGLVEAVRRGRYYEKPCRKRQRLAYENCRRVYNSEMGRKINFLARSNRQDPWLGC